MATRYQRVNQKAYIEGQTTQWPQDTKGVIRRHILKDRQHNGQKKKKPNRRTMIYKILHKKLVSATQNLLKIGGELRCCGRLMCSCFTSDNYHVRIK
jgi:hypothetical protein